MVRVFVFPPTLCTIHRIPMMHLDVPTYPKWSFQVSFHFHVCFQIHDKGQPVNILNFSQTLV